MLTCTCLLALTLAAPPQPVAQVVTATRDVAILRDGRRVGVTKDLRLLLTDTLDVPVGGVLFVQVLANGHVVRVDEDIQLPVKDLAALRLKKQGAATAVKDQVEALLTPKERVDLQPRLMGWFVSTTAANVPSVREEERRKMEDALVGTATKGPGGGKSDDTGGSSFGRGASTQSTGRAGGLGVASNEGVATPKRTPGMGASTETKATKEPTETLEAVANAPPPKPDPKPGAPRPPPPPPAPTPAPVTPPAQQAPAVQLPDAATRTCLVDAARALGPDAFEALGPTLTVKLRRGADGVKLFLEGGVPVPDCARAWASAQSAALPASGWLPVEVPLR